MAGLSWQREDMITHVQNWTRLIGRVPRQLDYEFGGVCGGIKGPSIPSIQKEFGTWNKFLEAAGLPTRPHKGGKGRKHAAEL